MKLASLLIASLAVVQALALTDAARADSWQIASPGINGSDYSLVATLGSPATAAYVSSKRPVHATHYKASLWIDPTGIAMPEEGTAIRFMNLVDDSEGGADPYGGVISVGFLRLRSSDHAWHVRFNNLEDSGSYKSAGDLSLGPAASFPMEIEIEFWTGGVGTRTFCVRKTAVPGSELCTTALDMENADVDEMRIGLFGNGNPAGWTGSYSFDEVETSW